MNPTSNRFKKRQAKRKAAHVGYIDIAHSDDSLRSLLGLILHRLWLYSKAEPMPAYQVKSNITFCRPFYTEREGFTQYYR